MADSIITMFVFGEDNPTQAVARYADVMQWRNEHDGAWPPLPPEPFPPRLARINGLANARSEPRAAPDTLIAELNDTTPPLTIIGLAQNGYYPVQMWVYVPRLTVSE